MQKTEPTDFPSDFEGRLAYIHRHEDLSRSEKQILRDFLTKQDEIQMHSAVVQGVLQSSESEARKKEAQILNPPLSFFTQTPKAALNWLCYRTFLAVTGRSFKAEVQKATALNIADEKRTASQYLQDYMTRHNGHTYEGHFYAMGEKTFGPAAMRIWNHLARQADPQNPLLYTEQHMARHNGPAL